MKKRKRDRGIAASIIVAWWSLVTYGACDQNIALIGVSTLIFGIILYLSWMFDRVTKSRDRLRSLISEYRSRWFDYLEQRSGK